MSAGVFTKNKRFSFVEGQETPTPDPGFVACGAGTRCPIELTGATVKDKLDKAAEIFYRVKDARYTGGQLEITALGGTAYYLPPSYYDTNKTYEISGVFSQRGYSCYGADDYNQAEYTVNGYNYSDISDNERGVWQNVWNSGRNPTAPFHPMPIVLQPITNAFTFSSNSPTASDYAWKESGNNYGLYAVVVFGPNIAVVRVNPTDGLYAPTNKFFLEFEFTWFDYPSVAGFGGGTNIYDGIGGYGDFSAGALLNCNYVLRLEAGDLSCPTYTIGAPAGADSASGVDIIHEAVEWLPYDRLAEPRQLWDSVTGEFVPIDAPFGAFDLDANLDQIFNLI